jgi:hypothetical protein
VKLQILFVSVLMVLGVSACGMLGGSSPVGIGDIPAYPGATELKAGDSTLANTLAKNSQQITALGQSAGAGGKTDQKGYSLPANATWDAVKKFYDDKLKSTGWAEPNSTVSGILSQVNTANDAFQTVVYSRGNQSLSVIRVMIDPTTKQTVLIFSLTTR